MTRRLAPLLALAGLLAAAPGPAAARTSFHACGPAKRFRCTTVPVPLDRAGAVPGTVRLAVEERAAPKPVGTVVFVTGGPGQSTLPSFSSLVFDFGQSLSRYDLVAFDPRGTGQSGKLGCPYLRRVTPANLGRCGRRLGERRRFYRTADSVEDLEAIRVALGTPTVSLVGLGYGTRLLGEYARRHPSRVFRMVLDSPVTLAGTDPFDRQRRRALPRVLRSICTPGRPCRRITRSVARDLGRVIGALERRPQTGTAYDTRGRRHREALTVGALRAVVLSADLDPFVRVELPAALARDLGHDPAPLLRLARRVRTGYAGARSVAGGPVDPLTAAATNCAEAQLPWDPSGAPGSARAEALAARGRRLGARAFSPWPESLVLSTSVAHDCLDWPAVRRPPVLKGRAAVPTLVLSGTEDLRTPYEQARAVARTYKGARLLRIPFTGASVIGLDVSNCARDNAASWIAAAKAVRTCAPRKRLPATAPLPPRSVTSLPRGSSGHAKVQTLEAVKLTLADLLRVAQTTIVPFRQGGLRGGSMNVQGRTIHVSRYAYIPGLRLTGTLRATRPGLVGTFTVAGKKAVAARVTLHADGSIGLRFTANRPGTSP